MTWTPLKVLVPVSGGKDSQLSLKLAIDKHGSDAVRGLFCDTKFEHPWTYEHVERMKDMYSVRIDTVNGGSVLGVSERYGKFPSMRLRHCTSQLKIVQSLRYFKELVFEAGPFEVWYGMRSDESKAREERYAGRVSEELYKPHEIMPRQYPKYLAGMGVRFRLPILDWTTKEVMAALNGEHNPLYNAGFDRVGCFPCLAAGDAQKKKAFDFDDFGRTQYVSVQQLAATIKKPIWQGKSNNRLEGAGCAVCSI